MDIGRECNGEFSTVCAPCNLTNVKLTNIRSVELCEATPDSLSAFQILMQFCRSESMMEECFAALAIVLMVPEHSDEYLILPGVGTPPPPNPVSGPWDKSYCRLFGCIDSCITLSCSSKGVESLLSGSFFEPSVSCNLVGSHGLGISKAIEPILSDRCALAHLMMNKSPEIGPLWFAAIWSGRYRSILPSAVGGMPPINLSVASWTNTIQSFLQIDYEPKIKRHGILPRAQEFRYANMVNPGARVPFTPSPPFGETLVSNTSLEVRHHLLHNHKIISHRTFLLSEATHQNQVHQGSVPRSGSAVCLPSMIRVPFKKGISLE